MATLSAFLSTTAGLLVAIGAVFGALGGLLTTIIKLLGTRSRLAKLEANVTEIQKLVTGLEKRLKRLTDQIKQDAQVESVRTSLLPEHANADDVDELRAEQSRLKLTYESQMRDLATGFAEIKTQLRLIIDGKVKIQ